MSLESSKDSLFFNENFVLTGVGNKAKKYIKSSEEILKIGEEVQTVVTKIKLLSSEIDKNRPDTSFKKINIQLIIPYYDSSRNYQKNIYEITKHFIPYSGEDILVIEGSGDADFNKLFVNSLRTIKVQNMKDQLRSLKIRIIPPSRESPKVTLSTYGIVFIHSRSMENAKVLREKGYGRLIIIFSSQCPVEYSFADGIIYFGYVGFHRAMRSLISRFIQL